MPKSMRPVALSLALALSVAGCASGGGGSDKSASSSGPKLSGDPVVIASNFDTPTVDLFRPAVEAAVDYVNAHGGIKGRPLKDIGCETKNSANNAAQCARDAVSNGVVADVGSSDNFAAASLPVLEAGGISRFGANPYTQPDFTSPVSYPLSGGGLVGVAAEASYAVDTLKAKTVSIVYLDVAAGQTLPPLVEGAVLKPRGASLSATVGIPLGAADVSAQVAAATKGNPDAVMLALTTDLAAKVIRTARQQGYKGAIMTGESVYSDAIIKEQLAGVTDDVYFIGGFARRGPNYKNFEAAMKKAGDEKNITGSAFSAWLGVVEFAELANKLPEVTTKAFNDAVAKTSDLDTQGASPTIDFTKPGNALGGAAPRIVNTSAFAFKVVDGKLTEASKDFFYPFGKPS